jgi:5-methyltetrahydropteroyltriglutamate--homocysteine methyltransferase
MIATATLGFPRIGPHRELKSALEAHWSGKLDGAGLARAAADVRNARWVRQKHHGIAVVPSNDFSLYDHVLDTCCLVGAVPERFRHTGGPVDLPTYFRLARGDHGIAALEMTKWFDTNYHYLVPELSAETGFAADPTKPVAEFREALAQGIATRPVLVGPVTFLLLAKRTDGGSALELLPALLPAYVAVLQALAAAGAEWIQLDEPCLVTDLTAEAQAAYRTAYAALAAADPRLRLLLTTYFGSVVDQLPLIATLPVHGVHLDLVRAPEQLAPALAALPASWVLSLGVVDGRNLWSNDLDRSLALVRTAAQARPPHLLQVAPSCSLLHVPVDLTEETGLDPQLATWLAFAVQKLSEVNAIVHGALRGDTAIAAALATSRAVRAARAASPRAIAPAVRARVQAVTAEHLQRRSPFAQRDAAQRRRLELPDFPTTTIGSFPQTAEVRRQRSAYKAGRLDLSGYETFLREETARCVHFQEECGLDVLVHGEFERNDMVEYFGELLDGYAFTANGWVQSYGSRCVKPPIIVGDVSRPRPMTVEWARYAQSLTTKPMKGMLTGPVTILQWSFVRDDLPRDQVCRQIALALRDEISDLEAAGIAIIQVDEPALREGLPLRRREHAGYLRWAVDCFRLATSGVRDDTQIHTHMCYSEFNDIIAAIAELDADVISIETARSRMELLSAFERFAYPNGIGPGVYDIHSPAVPDTGAMTALLQHASRSLRPDQVWVNPDCGLKTRGWAEVGPSLRNLVQAARNLRGGVATAAASG